MLANEMRALLDESDDPISNLANAAALLMDALPDINWVGFYLRKGGALCLGPFQGRVACTRIPMGRGVCGRAAQEDRVLRVADVHAFPGHIACDSASNSELVVPLHGASGLVAGVLDIDSPVLDRFSAADEAGVSSIARIIESRIDWNGMGKA